VEWKEDLGFSPSTLFSPAAAAVKAVIQLTFTIVDGRLQWAGD
jgi:hypothetical protein